MEPPGGPFFNSLLVLAIDMAPDDINGQQCLHERTSAKKKQ